MVCIRALEIGYGTTSVTTDDARSVTTIPSIVVSSNGSAEQKLGFGKSNSIQVRLPSGQSYLVGNELDERTVATRVLTSDFVKTDQYHALFLAALSKLDTDVVDVLSCGLPVNNMAASDAVKELAIGTHVVDGRKITIKDVMVFAQPIGTLASHLNAIDADSDEIHTRKLVIDCGYHTVDFLVAEGFVVSSSLNGAVDGGMSKLLDACQQDLETAFNSAPTIQSIDRAFYANHHKGKRYLKLFGKKYSFPVCNGHTVDNIAVNEKFDLTPTIERVTNEAASFVANKVGDGHNIDVILVGGGSGAHYIDAVKRRFPNHTVKLVGNPLSSVCVGLHLVAEMLTN